MAFGSVTEASLTLLLFNNTDAALIGDATGLRGSSTAGSFYLSLHTANPVTTAGAGTQNRQNASECAYTPYARIAVARSGAGWTCSANVATLASLTAFAQKASGGDETASYACIGTASTGTGQIVTSATLNANLAIVDGFTPQLTTSTTFTLT